jgi:hypothetical protein
MPSREDNGGVTVPGTVNPGGTQGGAQPGTQTGTTGGAAGSGAVDPGSVSTPDGTGGSTTVTADGTPVPCDVASVVATRCHGCHGPTPMGGAIKLTSHEDWMRQSPIYDPTKKVYEVAQIRINDGSMPQGGMLQTDELATLNEWLAGGAAAGTAADATCVIEGTGTGTTETGDGTGTSTTGPSVGTQGECDAAGAYDPLVARDGETCWDFPVHAPGNTQTPFTVQPNESYNEWVYDVPWPAGHIATRFGADFDNIQVLHHWLAFEQNTPDPAGTVRPNVTGTTLGTEAGLIGGWAVGGCNVEFPEQMGLELPSSGKIMIQWHHYNSTGAPQPDGTKVQFCTVPASAKPNIGGLTWLGTENFNGLLGMPQGENEFTGTCINDSTGPITIVAFLPHMHEIGIHMKSELQRAGTSTWETVFDQPFDFNWQVHYNMDPHIVMQPNDVIRSTCTFFNDTGANVAFGQSTKAEMCYQFAFSYPAGALDNGVPSLIGATNTCWQFGE